MDPALFFPSTAKGRSVYAIPKEARDACATCPVIAPCREWAIRHEASGFQGGLTERERGVIRREEGIMLYQPEHVFTSHALPSPKFIKREIPHGTHNGYRMELRRKIAPCEACTRAHLEQGKIAKAKMMAKRRQSNSEQ